MQYRHTSELFLKKTLCVCFQEPFIRSAPFKAFKDTLVLDRYIAHLITNSFFSDPHKM